MFDAGSELLSGLPRQPLSVAQKSRLCVTFQERVWARCATGPTLERRAHERHGGLQVTHEQVGWKPQQPTMNLPSVAWRRKDTPGWLELSAHHSRASDPRAQHGSCRVDL